MRCFKKISSAMDRQDSTDEEALSLIKSIQKKNGRIENIMNGSSSNFCDIADSSAEMVSLLAI